MPHRASINNQLQCPLPPTGNTVPYGPSISKFDPYEHFNLQLNLDGTVTRLLKMPQAPADPDPKTTQPVISKDYDLDPSKDTSLRVYLPTKFSSNDSSAKGLLPIFIHFHGCYWVQHRAKNFPHHLSLTYLALTYRAIIICVDYRLAPESKLPAQYEDAMDTLLWIKKQALDPDGDPWLKNNGDFSKCYLHGSGCGANIGFHAVLRAMDVNLDPLKIAGVIMNQPLFGGQQRTQSEIRFAADQILPLPVLDLIWELALPKGTDRDHRFCNPMVDGPHKSKLERLPRCLVFGFGMDPLVDRQQEFVRMLVAHGVRVEAQFDEDGFHRIELVDPRRAITINTMIKEFLHPSPSLYKNSNSVFLSAN